jgi:hypothetical protein
MFETLISQDIDPNELSFYVTPTERLHLAPVSVLVAENTPSRYITQLLDSGRELTEVSGKKILLLVSQSGRKDAIRFLIELGVKPDCNVMEYATRDEEFGLLEFFSILAFEISFP